MAVFNRRLIFWLVKAYIKRWGRIILISFLIGLGIFFVFKQFLFSSLLSLTSKSTDYIGVVGAYTASTIPQEILSNLSEGLTVIADNGTVHPGIASSWQILDGGKTYRFTLKKNIYFTDGTHLVAKEIQLAYSDVRIDRPDDYHIVFHLKENYAPFLVTLSKPVFRKNFVGVGPSILTGLNLNGSFVENLSIRSMDGAHTQIFHFYPTDEAVKIAFVLGEITTAANISDIQFQNTTLNQFANTHVSKSINYSSLVTLFYNTQDKNLSDRKIRDAFSYAIPNAFSQGERAYSPIPPNSWAYSSLNQHTQDIAHADVLLDAAGGAKNLPVFTLDTLSKYHDVAKIVQKSLLNVGIRTKIVVVESIPDNFELFLGDFSVSKDPDQYTLWHSYQSNNITNFNSDKRIDKLLEDGRQTVDVSERVKIYADFQKYLLDEEPATFLYFPNSYTVKRK